MGATIELDTAVIIVGGGPVGLCLAADLGRRGVDCIVLERRGEGEATFPTANHISVRTMEHLRQLGLSDAVRKAFRPDWGGDVVALTHIGGYEVARIKDALAETKERPDSPEREIWAPKPYFDPILLKAAQAMPNVEVRFGTSVHTLDETSQGVVCSAQQKDGNQLKIHATYAVACDGAASGVREALGIEMIGPEPIPITVHSAFFRSRHVAEHVPPGGVQYLLLGTEEGPVPLPMGAGLMIAVDGYDLWRLHGFGLDADNETATLARLSELGIPDAEIISMSAWTPRQALAETFRQGRVFLAGDAAHIVTPFGGLGVNTGMCDAFNLSWKLAAVLEGWGGSKLLDESYEKERRAAALELLAYQGVDFSEGEPKRLGPPFPLIEPPQDVMWKENDEGNKARHAFGALFPEGRMHEYEKPQVDLGIHYDDSPIICYDGSPPQDRRNVRTYAQTTAPGGRAPHVPLANDRSTLDLFGDGFTLLCTHQHADTSVFEEAARDLMIPLRVECVPKADIAYEKSFTLVRPDGVVAWRDSQSPQNPIALMKTVAGAL